MKLPDFKLEEFWKKHEFTVPHLFCCSDMEAWTLQELLALADADSKALWDSLSLGYTEPPGHPILRKEIAQLYNSLEANHVHTFAGAEEGIYCTMKVLVEPGDHIIAITPCYQSLATLPEEFGGEVSTVQLKPENGWNLDVNDVEKAFRSNTKLLVLNYPHNPTGAVLDSQALNRLVDLARKHNAYIFCDEVYRFMEVDEADCIPSIADVYEKGISLNVMTKSFGLAGLRIGWLASRDTNFLTEALSYKLYTSICNSATSEILAIMALSAKETILQRNRDLLHKNLSLLDSFMKRNEKSVSWIRPKGGTIGVIKLLLPISVETFAEELIRCKGILVMPGSVFDLSGNYFRIGFGKKDMPEILEMFESFLQREEYQT